VALLVILSTAGSVNGNMMPCARVIFAMGGQRQFFSFAGKVHPKHHTPSRALILQASWAALLVMLGSFDMLMDMFVFITWIFYGFAAYGIFILRRKMPNAERPYRMKAYPVLPIIFIAFAVLYISMTLYSDIRNYNEGKTQVIYSVLGLLLTAAGVPLYYYFRKK
jgi:APA family basic amino acid/polyamine antiporter